MANFTYKRTMQTAMKISGIIDTDKMTVTVDGIEKDISTLLSDFNGAEVEINIKTKDEEELDEPSSSDEDE